MVERYPNLKEEVGGLNPDCEIPSLLDGKTYQVVNCLMCFDASLSVFCVQKRTVFQFEIEQCRPLRVLRCKMKLIANWVSP